MQKIKVVHLVEDLKVGGIERMLATMAYGLDKSKFDVKVWCLVRGGMVFDEIKSRGIDAEILGMGSHRNPFFYYRLSKKLRNNKTQIVHCQGFPAHTVGRLAAIFARVPVIIGHVQSNYWRYPPKKFFIERFLSRFTDKIICISESVVDFVVNQEKIAPEKTVLIYNGIDIDQFRVTPKVTREKEKFVVGCVASLFYHKGHRYLLEAAKYILDNFSGNVEFSLLGDGAARGDLEKQAQDLGIVSKVKFLGFDLDVSRIVSLFDLVVLPSTEREGLGIALIEAMAAGKPVVGTLLGGIPEVIEDGVNGILVPPKDSLALAKAIISIIENPQKSIEMGRKGREIAEKKFSVKVFLKKIEALYLDCLNK